MLYEAVKSLFLSWGVKKVLGQTGQAAAQLVRAEASFIELLSDYKECMWIVWHDSRWGYIEGHGAKIIYTLLREAIDTKQSFIVPDSDNEERFASEGWFGQVTHGPEVRVSLVTDAIEFDLSEARTMLVVPLVTSDNHLVGALYVDRKLSNKSFSSNEQRLLEAFAIQAANAIYTADQYRREKNALFNSMHVLIPEYRTPLTAISGYISILQSEGTLTGQQKECLKWIAEATKKLYQVVHQMAQTLQDWG